MKLKNLFAVLMATLFSVTLNAQTPDPEDEPDPTAPDKSQVVCGATARLVDANNGASSASNTGNVFKLTPISNASDKRANASNVITLEKGYEVAFTLTYVPSASGLVHGEDLLTVTARLQRKEPSGQIKVLAESSENSDRITTFGELNGRRIDIPVRLRFNNPEVSTVLANFKRPITPQEAVRAGLLPDGIANTAAFDCYMRVGKAPELIQ
jgi:hypothetical protein